MNICLHVQVLKSRKKFCLKKKDPEKIHLFEWYTNYKKSKLGLVRDFKIEI